MKTQRNLLTRLLVILSLMLFVVSCASVASHFSKTREIDTIEAYEEFIQNYPDSEFATEAKKRIEQLEAPKKNFEAAKAKNTVEVYRDFIARHPESDFVKEAELRIREIILSDMTIDDLINSFIDNGIEGKYVPDESPTPYNARGVFRNINYVIIMVEYNDEKSLYIPWLQDRLRHEIPIRLDGFGTMIKYGTSMGKWEGKYEMGEQNVLHSMGNHMSLLRNFAKPDSKYGYKELFYLRDDPFFICGVTKSRSLLDKIDQVFLAIGK